MGHLTYDEGFTAARRDALEFGVKEAKSRAAYMRQMGVMTDSVLVWYHGYVRSAEAL